MTATDRSYYYVRMGNALSTRGRILEQGLALMSQNGFAAVTLGILAGQVGMSKSGLFAHFKSKEDVQIGLLEHAVQFAQVHVIAPAMKQPIGLPRLKAVIANWFGWTKRAGLPGGCPVAAGMFEFDDVESPVRDTILARENEWRAFLEQRVTEAATRGHLKKDLDAQQFVWELCGIYLAHHAAYRFVKAKDADQRANIAISSLLARSSPAKKASGANKASLVSTKRM